jgi:hypothetical protein
MVYRTKSSLSAVDAEGSPPISFQLQQNYPNPFNPSTLIGFRLPAAVQVSLAVYAATGQQVQQLAEGVMAAGTYEIEFDGRGLASGVYFCRLTCTPEGAVSTGGFTAIRKMLLVR